MASKKKVATKKVATRTVAPTPASRKAARQAARAARAHEEELLEEAEDDEDEAEELDEDEVEDSDLEVEDDDGLIPDDEDDDASEFRLPTDAERGDPKTTTQGVPNSSIAHMKRPDAGLAPARAVATARRVQKANKKPTRVRVVAVRMGYYDHKRRRPGAEFIYTMGADEKALPTWVLTKSAYDKATEEAAARARGEEPADDEGNDVL